jgi:hypothetical protein
MTSQIQRSSDSDLEAAAFADVRGRRHRDNGRISRSEAERYPALAAFSAFHHQTAGNAAPPYLGIESRWPKRSQRALRTLP